MKQNFFDGEFAFAGSEISENGRDWVRNHSDYDDGLYDWKFEQKSVFNLPSGNAAYGGVITLRLEGHAATKMTYIYYSTDNILCINSFECGGEFRVFTDIYEVEHAAGTRLLLYPIESSRDEPKPYKIRVMLNAVG